MSNFNDRVKQLLILVLLLLLIHLVIRELKSFLPGLLGALTLYILSRAGYFQLVFNRKWKKGWAAGLYIIYYLLILGLPIFMAVVLISPKVNEFLSNPNAMVEQAKTAVAKVQENFGIKFISPESLNNSLNKLSAYIPNLLNSTANLITNLAVMLFILYYMLYNGSEMEKFLIRVMPLKSQNTAMLATETKKMVKANALGIPLISIIQGATATLGYFLFGVKEWALWGFLTGIFAFFPVVGTMIVWVPLVIYTYATGESWQATALLFYSIIVTGNVDYIARITLLRRMGNVHPVITILGVIVGLGLFGFIGLIFGPLLVNYVIVLFNIYVNEFIDDNPKLQIDMSKQEEEKKGDEESRQEKEEKEIEQLAKRVEEEQQKLEEEKNEDFDGK
jgi:predicted PurR-regulated permease PerM